MANEPSLSELTHLPAEATINPGVIRDNREAISQLNQSAQFNAEMKQRRYELGLNNLKGIYQDLGAIQEMPMMQQDRPLLYKEMGDILNKISEDPRSALGGPGFNDIQRQLGALRSKAVQSKQDYVYNDFHEKTIQQDPELNTPENRAKMSDYNSANLGTRNKFLLDMPVKFDPEAAMGNILKQKQVAVPYANTSFEGPNNEWMVKETGTTYGRQAALDIWNQGYNTGTDANNQPIKKWATEQFNRIKNDPTEMQRYGNPQDARQFYQNLGALMYGSNQDIVGEKSANRVANPYTMLGARQNNALYMEAIKEGNREKLAAVRANLQLQGAPANANFILKQYANVVGNLTGEQQTIETTKGNWSKEPVVDVPDNILKNYVESKKETIKEGHSTDPVTETIIQGNRPDLVTRTKDGNLRILFYKRYTKSDKIPKGKQVGDIIQTADGKSVSESVGVIPKRNLMAALGKGIVSTKLLPLSIDAADKALQNNANEIIDKVNAGDDEGTFMQQADQTKKQSQKSTKKSIPGF